MRPYQVIGLLIVGSALTFVVGMKVGERRVEGTPSAEGAASGDCCGPLPAQIARAKEAPPIPTGSGLPCLLVFGSGKCEQCQKADALIAALKPRMEGVVDVVHLDPDVYPGAAQKWRIRIIPTQIIVGAGGEELQRIEQFLPEQELVARLAGAGIDLPGSS